MVLSMESVNSSYLISRQCSRFSKLYLIYWAYVDHLVISYRQAYGSLIKQIKLTKDEIITTVKFGKMEINNGTKKEKAIKLVFKPCE